MSHLSKIFSLNSKSPALAQWGVPEIQPGIVLGGSSENRARRRGEGFQDLLLILEVSPPPRWEGETAQQKHKAEIWVENEPLAEFQMLPPGLAAALGLVVITYLDKVTAQCGVIWRKLGLVINWRHQRLCSKGEKIIIIIIYWSFFCWFFFFFTREKVFTYSVSNFSLQQNDLWTNSKLLRSWQVNCPWEKKKKKQKKRNYDNAEEC